MTTTSCRKTIRIGVYIPSECQLLDMACVDIFGTMSHEYFSLLGDSAPAPIVNLAPSIKIFSHLSCTHHISDPAVQPGHLDIVLVPGPDPSLDWSDKKKETDWLAAHAARPETDILSVCTGIYICGAAGLLKGKKACGPRNLQGDLAKKFEGVDWVGEKLRWVRDGNLWSSGGITNGNDLVSAYARHSGRFPGPVVELGLVMTDTGDRPQAYGTGQTAMTLGVVWQVMRAVVMGLGKKKVT
ncbi:hypothetical protein N0V88_006461 [Collariella sp. IMI 366227]|nr:hypothetical protein N0V88_006461 [Collariella sp. IMI 366227]